MIQNGLKQYRGELSTSEIAAGIAAAHRNALRLAADARLLLDNGRYASATALAVLSIEESGKSPILRGMSTMDAEDAKREWKDYRQHRSKNAMWILPGLVASGKRRLDELKEAVDRKGEHTWTLDYLKQVALYTDCLGNKHWSEPKEVVSEELAEHLVLVAECFSREEKRQVTVREMELWVEQMVTHEKRTDFESRKALVGWWSAMIAEGLAEEGSSPYFEKFVFGEEGPNLSK
jgi:AbiV family abortive infection protein